MDKKHLTVLLAVVIFGAFLRLIFLSHSPPSLNWDEISHGYNAYSILKTGMDQWGERFPLLNFRAYGDYPTTLNLYLTIPFIRSLGLNELSIRLPHAILGILTIVSTYFLTFGVTKSRKMSLLTSFLVGIGPWYVFTSRFVLQSNLSVFLLITSAAFFVNRAKNKKFIFVSGVLLFLTLFSYHTTRIFSPLLLIGLLSIYRDKLKNKLVLLFALVFLGLSGYILFNPEARVRGQLLFLVNQAGINKIETARNTTKLPKALSKLLNNRPVYFATNFTKNYISYFSPKFLFLEGGSQYQFSVPGRGLLYPISLPFFYIGFFHLVFKAFNKDPLEARRNYKFLLYWLLLSPVPASLTNEAFTVVRATPMLPIPEVLTVLGFYWFIGKLPLNIRTIVLAVYVMVALIFTENYFLHYFTKYQNDYSWSWQYGYKEAVSFAKENYGKYDSIIITKKYGEPHEYFLFFTSYDPKKYLAESTKITYNKDSWWWVDRFDKFWFINDWEVKLNPLDISSVQKTFVTESGEIVDCDNAKCLLVSSPGNFPPGWTKIKTINFLDNKPAFELYEN